MNILDIEVLKELQSQLIRIDKGVAAFVNEAKHIATGLVRPMTFLQLDIHGKQRVVVKHELTEKGKEIAYTRIE